MIRNRLSSLLLQQLFSVIVLTYIYFYSTHTTNASREQTTGVDPASLGKTCSISKSQVVDEPERCPWYYHIHSQNRVRMVIG